MNNHLTVLPNVCLVNALIHDFVSSRADFGNAIFVWTGLPLILKLHSVLNSSACLIGCITKYGNMSVYIRDTLQWLPIPQGNK